MQNILLQSQTLTGVTLDDGCTNAVQGKELVFWSARAFLKVWVWPVS